MEHFMFLSGELETSQNCWVRQVAYEYITFFDDRTYLRQMIDIFENIFEKNSKVVFFLNTNTARSFNLAWL